MLTVIHIIIQLFDGQGQGNSVLTLVKNFGIIQVSASIIQYFEYKWEGWYCQKKYGAVW